MSNRKTLNEKIEAAKAEKQQAQNRISELLRQQKEQERRARNHRLCQRGGTVEKALPDIIKLTDEQFELFVKKALLSGFAARVIKEMLPPEPTSTENGADAPQGNTVTAEKSNADGNPQANTNPAPKPTGSAQTNGNNAERINTNGNPQANANPAPKPTGSAHNGTANAGGKQAGTERAAV